MPESKKKTRSKNKKNKRGRTFAFIAVLLVSAVFVGMYILTENARSSVETETVLSGTAEDKISVNGYVIRGEYVINAPDSGIISFRSDEGKRVSKDSSVAVIFSGDVSDDVKNELSSIHERLKEIEGSSAEKNLYAGDTVVGASQIVNDIDAISDAVYKGDTSSVPQYKDDITRLIRKNDTETETALTTYEQLTMRKNELEVSISGNATVIYAPIAGVLCSRVDGYENYFSLDCLEKITPEYLDNVPSVEKKTTDTAEKDSPCMKIVNNYEWFFAAKVDEKWAEDLKTGQSVSIRFTDVSDEKMDGTVYSISEPEDGKVAVVVESSGMFNGMYNVRNANVEIIRKTYKGFKVSKEAVHIDKDGGYYVYVNSEGIVRRRDVEILYSDDSYAIIKEDNFASNNLLLYDEVIVAGNNIKEGDSL